MFRTAAAAALGLALVAGPLYAGSEEEVTDEASEAAISEDIANQVSVNIDTLSSDARTQLTTDLGLVSEDELPQTIEVPAGIAIQVCGSEASEAAEGEAATCDATQTSQAFNQFVRDQITAGAMEPDTGTEGDMMPESGTGTDTGTDTEAQTD